MRHLVGFALATGMVSLALATPLMGLALAANIAAMTDRLLALPNMQNESFQSGVVQNDGFPQNGGFVRQPHERGALTG